MEVATTVRLKNHFSELERLNQTLVRFGKTHHIPRAILVGHSLAGGEVTLFAGKHPDRIIKLVYLDAIYDPERRLGCPIEEGNRLA